MKCERCGRTNYFSGAPIKRRARCVICGRLICRDCEAGPRMVDEVRWCRSAQDAALIPHIVEDDCEEKR